MVKTGGGLTALFFADHDLLARELKLFGRSDPETKKRMRGVFRETIAEVNVQLPAFSHVAAFRVMETEFSKTPTEEIERHLYQ